MSYPTIKPDQETSKELIFEAIRTESEGGYGRTRAKYTKPRYQFDLVYKAISQTDYQTLEDYFLANQGKTFDYIYPRDAQTYTCMFNQDKFGGQHVAYDKLNCKVSLITI